MWDLGLGLFSACLLYILNICNSQELKRQSNSAFHSPKDSRAAEPPLSWSLAVPVAGLVGSES